MTANLTLRPSTFALILDGRHRPGGITTIQAASQATLRAIPPTLRRGFLLIAEAGTTAGWSLEEGLSVVPIASLSSALAELGATWVGYIPLDPEPTGSLPLPTGVDAAVPLCSQVGPSLAGSDPRLGGEDTHSMPWLAPWIPPIEWPLETGRSAAFRVESWIASVAVIPPVLTALPSDQPWSLIAVMQALAQQGIPLIWRTLSCHPHSETPPLPRVPLPTAPQPPSVLVVIPHYRCEPWLRRCLTSIVNQTYPPDGIVVVDDGSEDPPLRIVADFPSVTLWAAPERVGPYRLIQQVIDDTAYDYYLFQDADDWSSCDRISRLLTSAEQTGADLIGTQEIQIQSETGDFVPVSYPLDVNQALAQKPGHPLVHPTSLVRRSLVKKLGGFATGLRFGGDTEFLLRAAFVGRILNLPDYAYFRWKRPHSLTTDPQTGLDSPERLTLQQALKHKAIANRLAVQQGQQPDLHPMVTAPPIDLRPLAGLPLRG